MTWLDGRVLGAAVVSLVVYGVVLVQLRRAFPLRVGEYAFELLLAATATIGVGLTREIDPLVLAAGPAVMFGACLLAGKGSIAVLVRDERFGDTEDDRTHRAKRRLGFILGAVFSVGLIVAVVT